MQIDMRVLELLSSKICHDLISPVSAINNGVELIEDIGGSVVDEAMKLIGNSAVQASRRLRVFRIAYGRAGSEENLPLRDVRQVSQQYFDGGKIKFSWPEETSIPETAEKRGAFKTLINLLIFGEEILAYGGSITLHRLDEGDKIGCRLEIVGRGVQLSPAAEAALTGETPIEDLTPRTIQSYMTGKMGDHFGLQIERQGTAEERLDLLLICGRSEYNKEQDV